MQAPGTSSVMPAGFETLLDRIAAGAREADVFGDVRKEAGRLACDARSSAEPATYRLEWDGGPWVSLVTANRWLSESIEADLMHTGDKLEELLEEEMVELGYDGSSPTFEHFRSEDLLFTFRTPLELGDDIASEEAGTRALAMLLGYEACFRQLGDMDDSGEGD
ncbi:MAG: hypothetical protein AAFX79_02165 [Planctomycetota bacterium]